jgi:hypothetical protein
MVVASAAVFPPARDASYCLLNGYNGPTRTGQGIVGSSLDRYPAELTVAVRSVIVRSDGGDGISSSGALPGPGVSGVLVVRPADGEALIAGRLVPLDPIDREPLQQAAGEARCVLP